MYTQLTLFDDLATHPSDLKVSRSGTFVDNMSLPVHRWFRYSAGFSAQWVEQVLTNWGIKPNQIVLDPFAGSGTVPIVCDTLGVRSIAVEAHPTVARICRTKLLWMTPIYQLDTYVRELLIKANSNNRYSENYPPLISRSFDNDTLRVLDGLKTSWLSMQNGSPESELVWLAITGILRLTSKVGTAQWQYILPNQTKKKILPPLLAFKRQIEIIKSDIRWMQSLGKLSIAELIQGDARTFSQDTQKKIDAVITSPPYANNFDYADALRFEMTFWGEVNGWSDIHDAVRKYLIVSSSQHSSRERLNLDEILQSDILTPIRNELTEVVLELARVREYHGGKKHYHTMVAAYCRDIGLVLRELRSVCNPGVRMCWVIGDSAPYGIYCPIEKWIAELAMSEGFLRSEFEKLRDRNIKWKNRKHRVPLKEGLLWIDG